MKNTSRIQVNVVGGIGNQLFTYYAGKYLAAKLDKQLIINTGKLGVGGPLHAGRLSDFNFGTPITEILVSPSTNRAMQKFSSLAMRSSKKYRKMHFGMTGIYSSNVIGFDPQFLKITHAKEVEGYFQTYFFFDKLVSSHGVPIPTLISPSPWFKLMSFRAENEKPIVVHVRRGDYSKPINKRIGLLGKDYFFNSIEVALNHSSNSPIWIMSDDLEESKEFFRGSSRHNISWVTPPNSSSPVESLLLMSKASVIIISNSTFSWWGAKLNQGSKSKVIAPKKWFKDLDDPELLIPADWTQIESSWV